MNSSNKVVACLIAVLVLVSFAFVSFAEEAPDVTVAPTTTEAPVSETTTFDASEAEPVYTTALRPTKPATTKAPVSDSFGTDTDSFGTDTDSFGTDTDSFGTDTDSFGTETDSEEGGFFGFIKGIINKIINFFMKIFAYLGLS